MRRISPFLLVLLLNVPNVSAQSRAGTTAVPFLTLGTGARGQALGHAYTTLATGGDALFWNPAGAARPYADMHRGNVFLTHYEWLADIRYNAAGVVVPVLSTGAVGFSIATVNYGDMKVRTVAFPEGTGETFSSNDMSLGLTYAQPLTQAFYFGGTVKYVRQQIRDMSASAIAFDFGFILETRYLNGMNIAASIQNFGNKMQMRGINGQVFVDIDQTTAGNNPDIPARIDMDRWDLPLAFKFGVMVPIPLAFNTELQLLADANQGNDNNLNSDLGAQLHYGSRTFNLDLRAGYKDAFIDNVDSHLTFGVGLDVRVSAVRFGFDFAYIPFDLLGGTRMIDLRIYY